ncbi:FAD-dependent oxidoreductase [Novosphingobium pentaromativorans]|uniref:FAD-dependent pyridine nucleotide-disulfide oxidoreductase n=1 Tax=Novosphingobium pentaromativorans US6-1 TaxID=1088721 RepID=G6E792_9SPHN|nr:FAD-dependent oxidoreductase [Novosphingobium pentaromativorans]AIT81700.1 pyridine nucleotide-disulfide oxidoreductase [Novosphingobium pentaromativorans US6-1]EHJ62715.1 FAD-dependent pyridine nucleotide-disulfide oxidoreductase [Novosphingobium pentaromativorans US6-1]
MRHIAIVGSGPAGYYTAEAALKQWGDDARVDIFDTLPVPFGLIRSGVAPDHQSIKGVSRRYEATALTDNVRFVGNVMIGRDLSISELQGLYDAVILATGAPNDRKLGIEGEDLPNVFGSASFVGWYNGHPDFAELDPALSHDTAVIIGNGNVALDVARILAKSQAEFAGSDIVHHALSALDASKIRRIVILGRRGPHQIAMTPKELGELGHLERACPWVDTADLPDESEDAALDPGQRKSVGHLRSFAAPDQADCKPGQVLVEFDFFASPKAIVGTERIEEIEVERTRLEGGKAIGTGETYRIPAGLVVACIGYQTSKIPDVPFDERNGRFANEEGRISPGLYCVGWARRGPTGTIGTNRPDGFAIIEKVAEDIGEGAGKAGRPGFDALAAERGINYMKFTDWQKIDEAEVANARDGSPREKFVAVEKMIAAASKP